MVFSSVQEFWRQEVGLRFRDFEGVECGVRGPGVELRVQWATTRSVLQLPLFPATLAARLLVGYIV